MYRNRGNAFRLAFFFFFVLAFFPTAAGSSLAWADTDAADSTVNDGRRPRLVGPDSGAVTVETSDGYRRPANNSGAALNVAALNYEDFAYATAGNGNYVNYQDPTVGRWSNIVGRTALRERPPLR